MSKKILVSVVIPIFNEEENIKPLYNQLKSALSDLNGEFEIIFISDGSTDKSQRIIKGIQNKDKRVFIVGHQSSLGKAAALGTGFDLAKGELVVMMDGDLQDDPKEIPKIIKKISKGYDLVSGRRVDRQDAFLKILTSKMMNLVVSHLSGFRFHDFYCGLKCFRRETLKKLNLYGDLYRFTLFVAAQNGLKIAELPVKHRLRKFGISKYGGLKRFKRALSDLAIILFVIKFSQGLVSIFNFLGLVLFFLGVISFRFSPVFGMILVVLGVLFFWVGLFAKMYHSRQLNKESLRRSYSCRQ